MNAILGELHPDFFTLRRELIGLGVMARDKGVYWRVLDGAEGQVSPSTTE